MIADEYKKEMVIGCDIDRIRKNNMNKRARISKIKKREIQLLLTRMITRTPEQYKKLSKNPWTCESRVVNKRPNECVCKGKGVVHNNASNSNMITEIKYNRIINVRNKDMNNI